VKPLLYLLGEELLDLCKDNIALRIGATLALPKPISTSLLGVDELISLDKSDFEVTSGARISFHDDRYVLLELVLQALL
jgi:hypothetical protein